MDGEIRVRRRRHHVRSATLLLFLVTWAGVAHAQDDDGPDAGDTGASPAAASPIPPPARSHGLEFTFTPGVWIPKLTGDVMLDPGNSIDLKNGFDNRDTEPIFNLEIGIVKDDKWQFFFSGYDFSTSNTGLFPSSHDFGSLELRPGDPFKSDVDLFSLGFEVSRFFYAHKYGKNNGGGQNAMLRGGPLFGTRYLDVDHEVREIGGGREKAGGDWLALYVGLQFDVGWRLPDWVPMEELMLNASAGIGPTLGGDNGYMWQVRASLSLYFTENIAFLFGFRLVDLSSENDGYTFDAGLQGLFFAAQFRF